MIARPLPLARSRWFARQEAAIAAERQPVEAACLRAERAGHLARHGWTDDARAELAALHLQFAGWPRPAVSAWLAMAEGWCAQATGEIDVAADRWKRALAMAQAAALPGLQALAAAWLAHLHQAGDALEAATPLLQQVFAADGDRHGARARAALVVANAYLAAGRADLAQPFHAQARREARDADDDATLSALHHHLAWGHGLLALRGGWFDAEAGSYLRHALAGVDAADNFDRWIGSAQRRSTMPLLRALLMALQGDVVAARSAYEAADAVRCPGRWRALVLADLAVCHALGGDAEGARAAAAGASEALAGCAPGQAALASVRLAQAWGHLGEGELALQQRSDAAQRRAQTEQRRDAVLTLLGEIRTAPC